MAAMTLPSHTGIKAKPFGPPTGDCNTGHREEKIVRYVKAALKLAAETTLISTVGSFFWMALGREVVEIYASGEHAIADGGVTFAHFFISIVQLYLLYRFVQWVIGFIAQKTAKTMDNTLQDVKAYSNVRDRVANVFVQDKPVPPTAEKQPRSNDDPGRCHSCGVLHGRIHLSGCQRNAP